MQTLHLTPKFYSLYYQHVTFSNRSAEILQLFDIIINYNFNKIELDKNAEVGLGTHAYGIYIPKLCVINFF